MKKGIVFFLVLALALFFTAIKSNAAPVDLSTFTAQAGVVESGGVVTFVESYDYAAIYFYDDAYLVPADAGELSFDYSLVLGQEDFGDYLVFELDYTEVLFVDTPGTGTLSIDLSPFQGTVISLAWGLIWDGDDAAGTVATVSFIDLDVQSCTVPIPGAIWLFGSGAVVLGVFRRRNKCAKV